MVYFSVFNRDIQVPNSLTPYYQIIQKEEENNMGNPQLFLWDNQYYILILSFLFFENFLSIEIVVKDFINENTYNILYDLQHELEWLLLHVNLNHYDKINIRCEKKI